MGFELTAVSFELRNFINVSKLTIFSLDLQSQWLFFICTPYRQVTFYKEVVHSLEVSFKKRVPLYVDLSHCSYYREMVPLYHHTIDTILTRDWQRA